MAEPFLAEIRIMSFAFAPKGWAQCFGQLLPINQNQALFALLGTTYGGNGQTTFALPDLQARVPMHTSDSHTRGEKGGVDRVNLNVSQMPQHTHFVNADGTQPSSNAPSNTAFLANSSPPSLWGPPSNLQPMDGAMIGNSGGNQPHENRQPFLALTFCIALQGIFPSPN